MILQILGGVLLLAILAHFFFPLLSLLLMVGVVGYIAFLMYTAEEAPRGEEADEESEAEETLVHAEAAQTAGSEVKQSSVSSLGHAHHLSRWGEFENSLSGVLNTFILLVESRCKSNTVGLFLPMGEDSFYLRAHLSNDECLIPNAQIRLGGDLIGGYLKEGITETILNELSATQDVAYYSKKDV